jgi:AcrR family transcriptional regulator
MLIYQMVDIFQEWCYYHSLPFGRFSKPDTDYKERHIMSRHAAETQPSHADERRKALVEAAYQCIAAQGLSGLRTREVAAQVGITHATLHYYFPSKVDLIQAVIDYAVFQRLLQNVPHYEGNTPLEQIHNFLTVLQKRMQENPDNYLVLYELVRNAKNEPAIQEALTQRNIFGDWHKRLTSLIEAGIEQGQFQKDLDPLSTASILITFILGLGMTLLVAVPTPDKMLVQLERLLTG